MLPGASEGWGWGGLLSSPISDQHSQGPHHSCGPGLLHSELRRPWGEGKSRMGGKDKGRGGGGERLARLDPALFPKLQAGPLSFLLTCSRGHCTPGQCLLAPRWLGLPTAQGASLPASGPPAPFPGTERMGREAGAISGAIKLDGLRGASTGEYISQAGADWWHAEAITPKWRRVGASRVVGPGAVGSVGRPVSPRCPPESLVRGAVMEEGGAGVMQRVSWVTLSHFVPPFPNL